MIGESLITWIGVCGGAVAGGRSFFFAVKIIGEI